MFRSWHGLFLLFSSTLTLLVMASMVLSSRLVREGADLVEHTNVIIAKFLELRAVVSEVESNTRSNVLMAVNSITGPLDKAESESVRLLNELAQLTIDSKDQQKLLQTLRPLVEQRLASLRDLVAIPPGGKGDAARKASLTKGTGIMNQMKDAISTGVQREQALYKTRDEKAAQELRKQTFTGIGGLILAVASGLASFLFLRRSHLEALRGVEMEQAALRAQEADMQKSQFLANMSHEIRTPMNAILGFTDLLTGMITEPRAVKYLQSIQSSGRALLELINEILDISRIEAGKLELRTETSDVCDIVESVVLMLKKQAADKGISLETKITGSPPPMLDTDPLRLRQVVLNIVANAVKFTHRGGVKVMFHASPVGDEKWDVVIKVADTGVGIQPEDHKRIFSAFEQASPHSRSGAQGTGLGLSITQKLVGLMGGQIEVQSTVGVGSEFTVTLRGMTASQKDSKPLTERGADFNQLRPAAILVVDDNATNRELVAACFLGSHHELFFAQDGIEALELARHAKPDVILMDIRMPRMDGKWARQILREDERTKSIPVIAQTASSMPEESEKLKQMFEGYLYKPFSPRQLFDQLEPVIGHATMRHVVAQPEKAVSAEIPLNVVEALEVNTTASWPGLVSRLAEIAADDIPRFLGTWPMREIAAFGNELQVLASRHDCPPLNRYASTLSAAAEAFELDKVESLLGAFGDISQRITKTQAPPTGGANVSASS